MNSNCTLLSLIFNGRAIESAAIIFRIFCVPKARIEKLSGVFLLLVFSLSSIKTIKSGLSVTSARQISSLSQPKNKTKNKRLRNILKDNLFIV